MKFSSAKIERLTGLPVIAQPNQFYLIEPPNASALFYLSDSGGNLILLNEAAAPIQPVSMADLDAPNNSIYYSTDASKLVYKDSLGTVNNLY